MTRTRLSEFDLHLFREGTHTSLFEHLGGHLMSFDEEAGAYFAVWAPQAREVYVAGDFDSWGGTAYPLEPRGTSGIWEGFVPGAVAGQLYKFRIVAQDGAVFWKADPFARQHETPPGTASRLCQSTHQWTDQPWMEARTNRNWLSSAVSVYEVHLGSWRAGLRYRELAPQLAAYVKELGFTHVEFLPVMEHPFYGSWGYQTTGYFAPTSRYGSPDDFRFLIDTLHSHQIGVILDWVPSHFPADEHALARFDGTTLFEYEDPRLGFHPEWKTQIFDYSKKEVRAFLISSARFWLQEYHADALRVDAVASMLYRDYARKEGQWIPNEYGGNENLEAISFLRQMNESLYRDVPGIQTIAEESTAWPMVSRPTYVGGLGFGFKWDMGWSHDTLQYFNHDPFFRKFHHHELTFRALYAFKENYMLPLSHDDVVYGRRSLLSRMPGNQGVQFSGLRLLLAYQWAQPGKKLLFMGGEFGQWTEWNHDASLDWPLLDVDTHRGVHRLVGALNWMYRMEPAIQECETSSAGFEWIDCQDGENNVLSMLRKGKDPKEQILALMNFSPVVRYNYRVGVPLRGHWQEILNTDAKEYGGQGAGNFGGVFTTPIPLHGRLHSVTVTLPAMGAIFFRYRSS